MLARPALPPENFTPLGHVSEQHLISLYRSASLGRPTVPDGGIWPDRA